MDFYPGPCRRFYRSTCSGLTLVSLAITITIIGILAGLGMPSLTTLLANHQADTAWRRLLNLVQFTRIEAANHRTQVIMCPTVNEEDCIDNWTKPIMVFVDENHNEEKDPDETIIRVTPAAGQQETIQWKGFGSQRYLRFIADGTTGNQNGRLTYCLYKSDSTYARQIIMSNTGRARRATEEEALKKC